MTPMDFPNGNYPYRGASQQNQQQQREQQQQQQRQQQQQQEQEQQQHHHHHHHHHQQQHRAHQSVPYQHYPVRPQHVEAFYPAPHHSEYTDYSSITPDHEDFEGCSEISTRPRLTKEQVDVLEAQFQAHPKPNSNVKRQLALQTKLTLPRVANWFQNRRAKAKQMKKQEEFEMTQGVGIGEAWNNEHHIPTGYTVPLQINTAAAAAAAASRSLASGPSSGASHPSATLSSADISSGRDAVQDASWASLQRALSAANTARSQYFQDQEHTFASLPYRDHQQHQPLSLPHEQSLSEWSNHPLSSGGWNNSSQQSEDPEFDFGFAAQPFDEHSAVHDIEQPQVDSPNAIQGFAISADVWTSTVPTPTIDANSPQCNMALHESDPLPMPHFPSSRRGSSSDELSATLDQFVLAGTPPLMSPATIAQDEQFKKPEQNIDIAARRKRPRPATLGTAALRSHSYGGPSAMSPTFRFGRPPQNSHPIRHVKSTGQNLNVKYAGIRKPSSAQRSPLNIATFAEAEEFSNLMAERKFSHQHEPEQSGAPPTPISTEDIIGTRLPSLEEPVFTEQEQGQETPHQYFLNGQPSQFNMASPPSTPMKSDFFALPQMHSMMPPMSAPPQYAIFPDYTPPYSAGPLTASSWSDAPLTSPEMATFPPATHLSQQPYVSPVMHEYSSGPSYQNHFVAHSQIEQKHRDITPPASQSQKQTEFFIQEFPRQKEEHAHAAQQMAQQKPKNYVFANATPSDF